MLLLSDFKEFVKRFMLLKYSTETNPLSNAQFDGQFANLLSDDEEIPWHKIDEIIIFAAA
jgi:hypothetical protein